MWFIGVEGEQEMSAPPPKKILDPPLYYMLTQKPYYRASVHRYKGCFWSDFCNGAKLRSVDLGMMLDVSEQVAEVLLLFIPYQTAW